jgi:outer membrane lipoprotein-sorting protein
LLFKNSFLILTLILFSFNLFANEKDQIINQLKNLNSLEFTFNQMINEKVEEGNCLLQFPGKLRCEYFDDKKKELIISNRRLSITQKRYNKTYYYPISKSPFLNILYKDKLLEIIKKGKLKLTDHLIKLTYLSEDEITILFDKKTLNLKGWETKDAYSNAVSFKMVNLKINNQIVDDFFKIPKEDDL